MLISLLSFDPLLAPPTDGTEVAWGEDCRHVHHPNRRFYALEPSRRYIGRYRSDLSWKIMPNSLVVAATATISAGGGSKSAPKLDLSVPKISMWRLFSYIYRLYHLAAYMRALEIAWWWREGGSISSIWCMWNILVKWAGGRGALSQRCRIATIRLMHANSRTLPCSYLPAVCIFWLLISFIGLLRVMGVNLLIAFNFYGPSSKLQEVNLAEGGWW